MYSKDYRCHDPLNPSRNSENEDRLITYKTLVSNEDQCAIIAGKWDISPEIVWKHHVSHNTTNENLTLSYCLIIRKPSSVILAQILRRSMEIDAAGGHKVSGEV